MKTSKTIRRRKLKNAFERYKANTRAVKREAHVENKAQWFENLRSRHSTDNCFDAWKMFVKSQKQAKTFVRRAIRNVEGSFKSEAFELWKKEVFS
mmetsp:Transcript_39163/g.37521  ORF Transcript_39163/g.37521 Transcript_39163/m.37521 type:complete len:95 (+) Transcript_39163:2150-2434(+)